MSSSSAKYSAPQTPNVCLSQNPLILVLQANQVKVYPTAQPNTGQICTTEWTQHQTCCDSVSLIEYAEKDIKQLEDSVSKVKKDVVKLNKALEENKVEIQTALNTYQSNMLKIDAKTIQGDLDSLARIVKENIKHKQFSEGQRDECFDRIKAIRTSSLCSTCSGRSAQFFLKGRALISMRDCKLTLKQCGKVWSSSVELIDAMILAQKITKDLKSALPKRNFKTLSESGIKMMQDWMGHSRIRQHIELCKDNPGACNEESSKYLCEAFISLKKNDFMEKAATAFSKSLSSLEENGSPATSTPQTVIQAIPELEHSKKQHGSTNHESKSNSHGKEHHGASHSSHHTHHHKHHSEAAHGTAKTDKWTKQTGGWKVGRRLCQLMTKPPGDSDTTSIMVAQDSIPGHLTMLIETQP